MKLKAKCKSFDAQPDGDRVELIVKEKQDKEVDPAESVVVKANIYLDVTDPKERGFFEAGKEYTVEISPC